MLGIPAPSKLGSAFARKTKALARKALVLPFVGMASPGYSSGSTAEVLAGIQAGLSGSVSGHAFSFAALGCQVVEVLSPAPGRAALWSHAVCPAASSAPRGAFAYSVYPLRGLETVSRAARCLPLRAAIALLYGEGDVWWTARESNPAPRRISRLVDQSSHLPLYSGATPSITAAHADASCAAHYTSPSVFKEPPW